MWVEKNLFRLYILDLSSPFPSFRITVNGTINSSNPKMAYK